MRVDEDMSMRRLTILLALGCLAGTTRAGDYASHRPMRPLPVASQRPLADGPSYFVDGQRGDDAWDGSKQRPWRTISHGASQLQAGDTLYLRGGTYYDHATVTAQGSLQHPVTLRSYPGELAIVDGGLPEYFQTPQDAWRPATGGGAVAGEFVSVRTYPHPAARPNATNVLGNFGDSMIPLHGYRFITDLRSDNEYLAQLGAGKTDAGQGAYCGPGLFYDAQSQRIHVRLAHTAQTALGPNQFRDDNYRGETDPRRLPLVVALASAGPALTLKDARHVRLQDLVVRGARTATLAVHDSHCVELDGLTMYGGATPIEVRRTAGLRLWNCACRGVAAPWTFRGSLKYRAIEARLFSASGWTPAAQHNRAFELAYSEFTDCVDGVFIGNVQRVLFHHNLLDNLSDDGLFVTATTAYDGRTPGGDIRVYQNVLSRCLTTFAFGVGHGRQKMTPTGRQTGGGVHIYRNVLDFRRPVHYQQPAQGEPQVTTYGRAVGDHGGPLWEPMWWYHNTILLHQPPFRNYYAAGLGGHLAGGSRRRVFNNIVVQATGKPGGVLPPVRSGRLRGEEGLPAKESLDALLDQKSTAPTTRLRAAADHLPAKDSLDALLDQESPAKAVRLRAAADHLPVDFQADANLHWSYDTPPNKQELLGRFQDSPEFNKSRQLYPAGWTHRDVVADPGFAAFDGNWRAALDLQPAAGSPAIDAGVRLPAEWPDPVRPHEKGAADIGALPLGAAAWRVGINGRLNAFGSPRREPEAASPDFRPQPELQFADVAPRTAASPPSSGKPKPVVILEGYPAFDAPLIEFALQQRGRKPERIRRTWLPPARYSNYDAVVIVGSLPRAKIEPNKFAPADLVHIRRFLEDGGTLWLMRGNSWVFRTPEGLRLLNDLTGGSSGREPGYTILKPRHEWVRHLTLGKSHEWVNIRHAEPLRVGRGEVIIGNAAGAATLYRGAVGRGQLIYVGWDVSASLPPGRKPSTVEQEAAYEDQMRILSRIAESL